MKVNATKDGVTLKLTTEEAIALEAVLGGASGSIARTLPWYDQIADALETRGHVDTISHAVEQRFVHFNTSATYWNGTDFVPDPSRDIRKPTTA